MFAEVPITVFVELAKLTRHCGPFHFPALGSLWRGEGTDLEEKFVLGKYEEEEKFIPRAAEKAMLRICT